MGRRTGMYDNLGRWLGLVGFDGGLLPSVLVAYESVEPNAQQEQCEDGDEDDKIDPGLHYDMQIGLCGSIGEKQLETGLPSEGQRDTGLGSVQK